MRAREVRVRPSEEKTEGVRGLATGPGHNSLGYNYTRIEQRVTLEGDFAGRRLTFSADVMAFAPEMGRLEIRISGEIAAQGEPHSGDGEWERLEVSAALPGRFAHAPVDVVLSHYDSPRAMCFFDDARLDVDG